jgi:hypothetical protein
MYFKLPTIKTEEINGNIKKTETEIDIEIIDSIYCQIKWEQSFPLDASKMAINDYIDIIKNTPEENRTAAHCIKMMKALFCLVEFKTQITFYDFCKMFPFSDIDFTKKLVNSINEIFATVYPDIKKNS